MGHRLSCRPLFGRGRKGLCSIATIASPSALADQAASIGYLVGQHNTDQGSQYTRSDFIGLLNRLEIQISMDGKGCWRDNVFVERVWKSVKNEVVYLHASESALAVRQGTVPPFLVLQPATAALVD